jgi:aryl-alcohol dehydrogenase-like predicted oxidoreductase
MQTRRLGNTHMEITPLGLGTWAMGGGGWEFAWGPQDDAESIRTIQRAVELGINWIDTAAVYGHGHSEEIVGRALKELNTKPYIFTKCSLVWDDKREVNSSLKAGSIRREAEASLRRLGVEAIDLYQIHWPNPEDEIEEGWGAMAQLKKEGKVRAIGVSNFNVEQMRRIQKIAPIDSLQPPYSLVHPDVERDVLPFCRQHNIGVIVYSPMMSGLLTGAMTKERIEQLPTDDWRKRDPDFQEPRLSRNLELAKLLEDIAYPHNVPAGVIAVAWTLHNPAVTGAIVGARHPNQIEDIVPAAEFRLTDLEMDQIKKFMREHPVGAHR